MIKSVTFILLLCIITLLAEAKNAANKDNSAVKSFNAEWKLNGAITKLYDTPLGEVFRFSLSPRFSRTDSKIYDKAIHSIQFELFKDSKERNEMRRFIVIDFKVRVFPAISKVKNPNLFFSFTRSMNCASYIKKYQNLNGIKRHDFEKLIYWQAPLPTNYKLINNKVANWEGNVGSSFTPAYEIISMRMIIDTTQDGFIASNVNKGLYLSRHKELFPNKRYPVYSFGILVEPTGTRKKKGRLILEVSKPKITFTDNKADLLELPLVKFEQYPYSSYLQGTENPKRKKRNLKRLKNPDEIYAHALNLLDGKDLPEGVELLTYIARKHEHVLAMNQLGICYWRGIGIKPNYEKALKWFRRAGEYNLPEALAWEAALRLKDCPKPHIKTNTKKRIYYCLNHIKGLYNGSKHATSVLAAILNYQCRAGVDEYKRSAKIGYWMVKNFYIRPFYRNSLYEDKGIAPEKSGMTDCYLNNRFYDYRTTHTPPCRIDLKETAEQVLNNAVKKNFPAAIYYKGQLLVLKWKKEKEKSILEEAIKVFKRGEKLGDLECAIEVMHCKARLGELKPEDFNDENFPKFSDHPLYYLLQYIVKNPTAPGVKEFLNRDYRAARRLWRKKLNGINHFLLALEGIYQYYHYGADTAMYRIYYGDIYDIKLAYEHLNAAVKANIKDAIYLKGVYLLNKKYNSFAGMRSGDISASVDLLHKVAPKNIKAQYYLIKNDFYNNRSINEKWLKQLKALRDLNFPDAWLLSSDILARLSQGNIKQRKKVIGAYKKTASLGCHRAWDRLAMLYYKNGTANDADKAKAEEYWKKFLEADEKKRSNDVFDPFWSIPKPPQIMTLGTKELPTPGGTMGISYRQLVSQLRKYYKFIGIDTVKKNDNSFQILKGGPKDKGSI